MKTIPYVWTSPISAIASLILFSCAALAMRAQAASTDAGVAAQHDNSSAARIPSTNSTALNRDAHSTVWQIVTVDNAGNTNVSSYTELATGLNFWNPATKQFEASKEI